MIEEKVMYAELRPMLLDKSIPTNDGKGNISLSQQMEMVTEAVDKKMTQLDSEGKLHLFPFGLKIIYCTPRSISKEKMRTEMIDCIKLKAKFPKLICGTYDGYQGCLCC